MQPSNPMQPRGSFVKPEALSKSIAEHEIKKTPPPAPQIQVSATSAEAAVTGAKQGEEKKPASFSPEEIEKERKERLSVYIKQCEYELGIEITQEDIRKYLFKGSLSKEVTIVPNMLKGTFKTMSVDDLQDADNAEATFRDSGKFTASGVENEKAILALSRCWTHADGKPLPADPTERAKVIRKMGALFVERANSARTTFDTLLRLVMQDADLLKK